MKDIPSHEDSLIKAIDGKICQSRAIGDIHILVQLHNQTEFATLINVLYVLDVQKNILSTTKVAKSHSIHFLGKDTTCVLLYNNLTVIIGKMIVHLYILNFTVIHLFWNTTRVAFPYRHIASSLRGFSLET